MVRRFTKTLTRHGNSTALVLDKPLMEILGLTSESDVELRTDGRSLWITPVREPEAERKEAFRRAKEAVFGKAGPMLARLAER